MNHDDGCGDGIGEDVASGGDTTADNTPSLSIIMSEVQLKSSSAHCISLRLLLGIDQFSLSMFGSE